MKLTDAQLSRVHEPGFLVRLAQPDYKHHRDFTPVAPLGDDCLAAGGDR